MFAVEHMKLLNVYEMTHHTGMKVKFKCTLLKSFNFIIPNCERSSIYTYIVDSILAAKFF